MIEHRNNERVPFQTSVHLEFEKFSGFITEYSQNISEGGLFLKSTQPLPVGTIVSFEFKLKDEFHLIQGLGEVVWIRSRNITPQRPAGMGIRFRDLTTQSRELIATMIANLRKAGNNVFDLDDVFDVDRPSDENTIALQDQPMQPSKATTSEINRTPPYQHTTHEPTLAFDADIDDLLPFEPSGENSDLPSSLSTNPQQSAHVTSPSELEADLETDFQALFAMKRDTSIDNAEHSPDLLSGQTNGDKQNISFDIGDMLKETLDNQPAVADVAVDDSSLFDQDDPSESSLSEFEAIQPNGASTIEPTTDRSASVKPATRQRSRRWLVIFIFACLVGAGYVYHLDINTVVKSYTQVDLLALVGIQSSSPTDSDQTSLPLAQSIEPHEDSDAPADTNTLLDSEPVNPDANLDLAGQQNQEATAPTSPALSPSMKPSGELPIEQIPTETQTVTSQAGQNEGSPLDIEDGSKILNLQWRSSADQWILTVTADGPLRENQFSILSLREGSAREVVKVKGISTPYPVARIMVNQSGVRQIRTGWHSQLSPPELHIVIDLTNTNIKLKEKAIDGATATLNFGPS